LIYIKRPGRRVCKGQTYHRLWLCEEGHDTSVVKFGKETELGSVFDDQATKAKGEAFEAACKDLGETGESSVVYEAVAKRIIQMARNRANVIRTT
jgi:hypothetical protein